MPKEEQVTLKKCTCGKDLKVNDIKYIGTMVVPELDRTLELFNCKHCKSTLVLKMKGE